MNFSAFHCVRVGNKECYLSLTLSLKHSAGVGRTGTLITIDCVLEQLKEEKVVDNPPPHTENKYGPEPGEVYTSSSTIRDVLAIRCM